jgi:hypothetical protein
MLLYCGAQSCSWSHIWRKRWCCWGCCCCGCGCCRTDNFQQVMLLLPLLLLKLTIHALENNQIAWTCTVHIQIDNIFPKTHSVRNMHPNTRRRHNTCTCNQSNRMDAYNTHSNRQPHTTMGPCIYRNILKHTDPNCSTVTARVFQFR